MNVLSTNALAHAIGVSESSIKRWADEGVIRCSRTAGGHRRIALAEALRFIRERGVPVLRPEILGLGEGATGRGGDEAEQLFQYLLEGAESPARGLMQGLYLRGATVAAIVDGPLRAAMHRIGELWRHDPAGIFVEHRATALCVQALTELRALLPPAEGGPVAVGGGAAGDRYVLPSLAAATALHAEGFHAVNLGPDVPLATLREAAGRLRPSLIWISASDAGGAEAFLRELTQFARGVPDVNVIVGGQGLGGSRPGAANVHAGGSMAELVAFARGLRVGGAAAGAAPGRAPA